MSLEETVKKKASQMANKTNFPEEKPESQTSDDELIAAWRQKRKERQNQHDKEIVDRGTVSKVMFDRKCATTPDNLYKLVEDFLLKKQFKLGSLSITKVKDQLLISRDNFLPIGQIEYKSINKEETWIEVVVYSTDRTIDETKELYNEAVRFFEAMCQQFDKYWPILPIKPINNSVDAEKQGQHLDFTKMPKKKNQGGKARDWVIWYDKMNAAEYVRSFADVSRISGFSESRLKHLHQEIAPDSTE